MPIVAMCAYYKTANQWFRVILGDPGIVSGGERKSKRRGNIGEEKLERKRGAPGDGVSSGLHTAN